MTAYLDLPHLHRHTPRVLAQMVKISGTKGSFTASYKTVLDSFSGLFQGRFSTVFGRWMRCKLTRGKGLQSDIEKCLKNRVFQTFRDGLTVADLPLSISSEQVRHEWR